MHDSRALALYLQMHSGPTAIALPSLILGLHRDRIVMYRRTRGQVGEMRFMGPFLMVLGLVVSSLRYR